MWLKRRCFIPLHDNCSLWLSANTDLNNSTDYSCQMFNRIFVIYAGAYKTFCCRRKLQLFFPPVGRKQTALRTLTRLRLKSSKYSQAYLVGLLNICSCTVLRSGSSSKSSNSRRTLDCLFSFSFNKSEGT